MAINNIGRSAVSILRDCARSGLKRALPSDGRFWESYVGHIGILKASRQLEDIRSQMNGLLELKRTDRVLDAGCGAGTWLSEIALSVDKIVGLDVEPGMLKLAENTLIGRGISEDKFTLIAGSVADMSVLHDESVDVVGSILVLGYVSDRQNALKEMFRVLKPSGRLCIVTPAFGARFSEVLKAEAKGRRAQGESYTLQNIKKLARGAVAAYVFGKMAEAKDFVGDWHFYKEIELLRDIARAGLKPVDSFSVYAGQAFMVLAKKPPA